VVRVSGVRMTGPWLPLDSEHVERLGGHMGVYELAAADGKVVRIGFAGGRSVFGLRGELRGALQSDGEQAGASFRFEITTPIYNWAGGARAEEGETWTWSRPTSSG
jgi:hypothetical protein